MAPKLAIFIRNAKTIKYVQQKATRNANESQTVAPWLLIASLIRAAVMAYAAIGTKPASQRVTVVPTLILSLELPQFL